MHLLLLVWVQSGGAVAVEAAPTMVTPVSFQDNRARRDAGALLCQGCRSLSLAAP